jgi:hypothetical protein
MCERVFKNYKVYLQTLKLLKIKASKGLLWKQVCQHSGFGFLSSFSKAKGAFRNHHYQLTTL